MSKTTTALLKGGLIVFLLALLGGSAAMFGTLEIAICASAMGLFFGFVVFWPELRYYMNGGNGE